MPSPEPPAEMPPPDGQLSSPEAILRRSGEIIRRLDHHLRRTRHLVEDRPVVDLRTDGSPAAAGSIRLLLVDDNAVIRDVLAALFRSELGDGVEIRTAASGSEALTAVPWRPDVIVLDWVMPGMDGPETARRLRSRGVTSRLVMYSSAPAAEAEGSALAAGADRYLEKGADADGLVRAVAEALEASTAPPAVARRARLRPQG